jgi:CNP1-like family
MPVNRRWRGAMLAALAGFSFQAGAQWRLFESDFDENAKPWKEIESRLPAYPKDENLIRFEGGGGSPHRFFVDSKSVSIGEDGVIRYTLVVRTAGGATNVSFEGIRCSERHLKVYALGRAGGSWARARDPQWRRIEYQDRNNQHGVLVQDYFCGGISRNYPRGSVKEILDRLRNPPRMETLD